MMKMKMKIKDDDLLGKCNTSWVKVSADIKKNLIANLNSYNYS